MNIGLQGVFVVGTVRTFQVTNAPYVRGGTAVAVPADAIAVTGNLTVTSQGKFAGLIALGPKVVATPTSDPTTEPTTLNFSASENRANNVTLGLAPSGTLQAVYRGSAGKTANLIFDVTGYFTTSPSGSRLHMVTPGRILDTRPTGGAVTHIDPATGGVQKFRNKVVRNVAVVGVTPVGGTSASVPAAPRRSPRMSPSPTTHPVGISRSAQRWTPTT